MQDNLISYIHPLNERLRVFLRLSFLIQQAQHTIDGTSIYDSHITLRSLLDIINFVSQQDIKKEVLKELERIGHKLTPLQESPDIKHGTLSSILASLEKLRSELHAIKGPIANDLRENEFLKVVQQKANLAGGFSEFDPPLYCHWLLQPPERRIADLKDWFSCFETLYSAIALILNLIRESAVATIKTADNGNYQQTLDPKIPYQLLIVNLPADSPCYAEISGGKHRITIRFMDTSKGPRPVHSDESIEFQLNCCAL